MEHHLDAVMTELLDFAGRNPDAVAEAARDRGGLIVLPRCQSLHFNWNLFRASSLTAR